MPDEQEQKAAPIPDTVPPPPDETIETPTAEELFDEELRDALSANQIAFLVAYAVLGVTSHACKAAQIHCSTPIRWAKGERNAETQEQYNRAFEIADRAFVEDLEKTAITRARSGWLEPILHEGVPTGHYRRKFDGQMLKTLLASRMPDRYSPKVDHTHKGTIEVRRFELIDDPTAGDQR